MLNLNRKQIEVQQSIYKILTTQNPRGKILVEGYAGTGKSTGIMQGVLSAIEDGLISNEEVVFTFPTNKLKNTFSKKLVEKGFSPDNVKTIYQLLKYYPKLIDEDRSILCTGVEDECEQAPPFKLVVVDEAFALPEILIDTIFNLHQSAWILSGDRWQLPPVGEAESKLLRGISDRAYVAKHTLDEIVRQENSDLAILVDQIRLLGSDYKPALSRSGKVFKDEVIPRILDGEDTLVLSYTNRQTREYSQRILDALADKMEIPSDAHPMFYKGSKLTIKCFRPGQKVLVPTNDTIVVEDYNEDKEEVYFTYEGEHLQAPIWTARRELEAKERARIKALNPRMKTQAWGEYDKTERGHIIATSAYTSTVHSSQGLGADKVFINWPNIMSAKENRDQLAYVAASRAIESLYFLS